MARRVGVVSVDFQAGTAKFVAKTDQAKAKLIEFGQHGVSNVQATSAALRVMEGNMTNNIRAAERFLANVLGLGPALKVAFPVVGAVAFLGVVGEMGTKFYDFIKGVENAPEKIRGVFGQLNSSLRISNEELELANARLENDIAKLEGRRQNTLATALMEAKVAADKLGESLEQDLAKLEKVVRDQSGSSFNQFWTQAMGSAATGDIAKELGGETGSGGFRAKIQGVANDPLGLAYKQQLYEAEIRKFEIELAAAQRYQEAVIKHNPNFASSNLGGFQNDRSIHGDMTGRIEMLQQSLEDLRKQAASIPLGEKNIALTGEKEELTANAQNEDLRRPFKDRMAAISAQIDAVKAKMAAIGKPESAQIWATAFGEAQKAIEEVNKALEKHHTALTKTERLWIMTEERVKAEAEAETEWKSKYTQSTTAIEDRIKAQQALAASIGKGYEATRAANTETRLMQELGSHYGDSAWMQSHAGDVSRLRSGYSSEYDAQHQAQVAGALDKLGDQVALERDLVAVQAQGAEAVRQVELAHRLATIAKDNDAASAKKLMAAEVELYNLERQKSAGDEVDKLNQKIEATERLAAATLKGADAVRQANLENRIAEILRDEGGPTNAAQARIDAATSESQAQRGLEASQAAVSVNRVQQIDNQIAKLQEARATLKDTLAVDIAIRDLENQKLHAIVEQTLATGGARNGLRAFFQDMEAEAQRSSQKIAETLYNALHQSVDGISDELAKMATGQYKKGDFGKMLQGIGEQATSSTIKNSLETGLGALGRHFGIKMDVGKPDGSQGKPYHVVVDGSGGALPAKGGKLFGGGDNGDGTFSFGGGDDSGDSGDSGGGGIFGSILKSLLGPGRAGGGDVNPGTIYPVGERGIEYLFPRFPGTVVPAHKMNGGSPTVMYHIDARGAALGVENRIARTIEASSHAAVAQSVRAEHERHRRTSRSTR